MFWEGRNPQTGPGDGGGSGGPVGDGRPADNSDAGHSGLGGIFGDVDSSSDPFGLAGVMDPLAVAVGVDVAGVGDIDLCGAALRVEALRRSLDAVSVRVLGELDARGTTDTNFGMRTGPWLSRETGLPGGAARVRVKTANKLRIHLSEVADALSEGRIGYDHARTLADAANPRIIDEFAAVTGDLIDLVDLMTFDRWRREVLAMAEILDADGGHKPGDEIEDNTLRLRRGLFNTLGLEGQFAGANAVIVKDALEQRADQIFARMTRDETLTDDLPVPPRKTLLALALLELINEGLAKGVGTTSGPENNVAFIVNAADPDTVTDFDGIPIGDTDRATLMCDPVFKPVVIDVHGVVTDLGRDQRLATRAQKRALEHRDGGCVWPGCDNPAAWTDAHHVLHWEHGGATDKANLAPLCRYHHMVTHRKGWTMHVTDDQWFWWLTPTGDTFWSQRHGKQRTGPTPTIGSGDGAGAHPGRPRGRTHRPTDPEATHPKPDRSGPTRRPSNDGVKRSREIPPRVNCRALQS